MKHSTTLTRLSVIGLGTFVGLGLFSQPAKAILIQGVTVSTNMGAGPGYNIINTVNGQGLPGNIPSLTDDHDTITTGNSWRSTTGTTVGSINFQFPDVYKLTSFSFWNFNGNTTIDIQDLLIQTSLNGTNYTALGGAPSTFAQAAGGGLNPSPPEIFAVTPTDAQYVRFLVSSNYGSDRTGFSEVQFDGTPVNVPWETDALPIMASAVLLGGGVWAKRRLAQTNQK